MGFVLFGSWRVAALRIDALFSVFRAIRATLARHDVDA
jgi:hypothetical protein